MSDAALARWLRSAKRQLSAMRTERRTRPRARDAPSDPRPRVLALATWTVPTFTQKFVYQELAELVRAGFELRLVRGRSGPRRALPPDVRALRECFVDLDDDAARGRRDREHFRSASPEAFGALEALLSEATGWSAPELLEHPQLLRAFSVARLAERWGADYLHSYFFYEGSLAAFVAQQLLGIPRGVTCYADHRLADSPLKLVAPQLARADLVVATSRRIATELEEIAPACAGRILIKPNAIDTSRLDRVRSWPGGAERPMALVTVTRIDPKKGLPVLAEALAHLRSAGHDVVWHLVGDAAAGAAADAEEKRLLLDAIGRLELGDAVRLHGWQPFPEVARRLAASHLFVAPFVEATNGDKDGIPTALLEAMACGLPVVTTDSGSIPEAISHGVDGWIVPQRDPVALADAIARLARDPELCRKLGEAAAATARERFDVVVCEPAFHARVRALLRR